MYQNQIPPEVSIIIPTYYRNSLLEDAIRSGIKQDYDNVEIIVVDDSGENHAEPVVSEFDDIRYIAFDRNQGAQQARTAGIRAASGKYVQLLDDDDVLRKGKLRQQVAVLENRPEVGVVYCGIEWEDGLTVLPDSEIRGNILEYALGFRATACVTSTMLVRRILFTEILPLRDLPGSDDTSFKIRLAKHTKFEYLDTPLVLRRSLTDSRGDVLSRGAIEGKWMLLEEYAELYSKLDPAVRGYALGSIYLREGKQHLNGNLWSAKAIQSFWKLNRAYPELRIDYLGLLFTSLLGAPGVRAGQWLLRRLK